jgi:hypothetical protein
MGRNNAVKTNNNKSSTSESTLNSLANAGKEWEQQKKIHTKNSLFQQIRICTKRYDKALLDVKLALAYGATPEVLRRRKEGKPAY